MRKNDVAMAYSDQACSTCVAPRRRVLSR